MTTTSTAPTAIPSSPTEPANTATTGISILNYTSYSDSFGYFHIIGEVENEGSLSETDCKISVDYYDDQGTITLSGSGETLRRLIGPGEKSPFEIVLLQTPITAAYRLTVTSNATAIQPGNDLSFGETVPGNTSSPNYTLRGQLRNDGTTIVSAELIIGTFYNNSGTVTAVGYTFPDTLPLAPGATTSFTMSVEPRDGPVAQYSLYAEAGP